MKYFLYCLIVACLMTAGVLDIYHRSYKEGLIALLFAAANGLIFLWRT